MDPERRTSSRSSRSEMPSSRKRKIDRSPERSPSRGSYDAGVNLTPSKSSHKKSKKEKKKKDKSKKRSKKKSLASQPLPALKGVVGKREYRDSSVDSSSDDDRTVSTAASASSPNKHMRHRTDPSKSSDFRLKYDHADSQYHNKHDRNDRRDIRASAPVGPWSPTDDYEHHSADDNIQCRAPDDPGDNEPVVVLPEDLDNAPKVVECASTALPVASRARLIDTAATEIILPLEDQPLVLRARNTIRFGIRLANRQPMHDKQIQWNILQMLEAKMKAFPPLNVPLKFERRSGSSPSDELEIIAEFNEHGTVAMLDELHHTTFRVSKCASAVEVTATRVGSGGQLGGGVFDRLDPSSWLYPQPEGKADTATMRQLGAFALHVQNIPIRCFKIAKVKGPDTARIQCTFGHLGKLSRFQVVQQSSSSLNFDLYVQFYDLTAAQDAYNALVNRRFVQQLASGREFVADIHVSVDTSQYLSDANIVARAEALAAALYARDVRREDEKRRAREEEEQEIRRQQEKAEALQREQDRLLKQKELEAEEARRQQEEEERRKALETERRLEQERKEAEEEKRREDERRKAQEREARRRSEERRAAEEERQRLAEEARRKELEREAKLKREEEKKAAEREKRKHDEEERKKEHERQAKHKHEQEKKAAEKRKQEEESYRREQDRESRKRAEQEKKLEDEKRRRRDREHETRKQPDRGDSTVRGGDDQRREHGKDGKGRSDLDRRGGDLSKRSEERRQEQERDARKFPESDKGHHEEGRRKSTHDHRSEADRRTSVDSDQHFRDERRRDVTNTSRIRSDTDTKATQNASRALSDTKKVQQQAIDDKNRSGKRIADEIAEDGATEKLSETQKKLFAAEEATKAAEDKANAAVAASEAATAQIKTRAQAAVKLVRQTESKKTKEAIEKAVAESTAQVEKARELFRQQLTAEQAARAQAEERAQVLEKERVALQDALAVQQAASKVPGPETTDTGKVPCTTTPTTTLSAGTPAPATSATAPVAVAVTSPVGATEALDAAQIAAVNLALAVTGTDRLLSHGDDPRINIDTVRNGAKQQAGARIPPPPPPLPEEAPTAGHGGIIQLRAHQRWPQAGEHACVMCGRFAEYESSETGDGVCSIECKNAQINSIKVGSTHVPAPPRPLPPLPMAATVPRDYGMVATLDHGSAIYSVALTSILGPRIVYSTGVGNMKHWDVTSPQRNVQPLGAIEPLRPGTKIRCCRVVPGSAGNVLLAGDASKIAIANAAGTAVVNELAHGRFTRGPSSQESLLWPAWARRKPRTSPSHAKVKKGAPLGGEKSPISKKASPSSKLGSPASQILSISSRGVVHASVSPSPPVTPTSTHRSVHYTTLAVMPTQPLCFGGTTDGTVHIWDVHTRELVRVLYGHVGAVTGLSLACDARTLVSSATDGTVRVWNLVSCTSKECTVGDGVVRTLCTSPVEMVAIVGCEDGSIWSLDLSSMAKDPIGWHHDCVRSVAFARSGEWFVTTGRDPQGKLSLAIVWHRSQRRPLFFLKDFEKTASVEGMLCCAISADGSVLVTGSSSGTARVYQMRFGTDTTTSLP